MHVKAKRKKYFQILYNKMHIYIKNHVSIILLLVCLCVKRGILLELFPYKRNLPKHQPLGQGTIYN